MADTLHELLRALHMATGFVGLAAFWIPALTRKGGGLHVAAGWVFGACAYVVALTALGSTSWALLHPSSWAGEPVSLGQVPPDDIMFVAILGFLGLLLLHGVETGVRAMRTRRQPDQFAGWRPAGPQPGRARGRPGARRLRPLPTSSRAAAVSS